MKRGRTLAISGLSLLVALAAGPADAWAQGTPCSGLPNPVFMGGTTAVLPVIRLFGARLKDVGITLLWNESSEGCTGVAQMIKPAESGRPVFSSYTALDSTPNTKTTTTTCNGIQNQPLDLVINDVYWSSCIQSSEPGNTLDSAGIKEFLGPVQGVVPVVPNSYLYYDSITAPELQNLYICGAKGRILTFTTDSTIFEMVPCDGSGFRSLFGRTIGLTRGLPNTIRCGGENIGASSMIDKVGSSTTPDTAVGYTSTEFYDESRDKVRALKVRGINQNQAYLPDSSIGLADKINIREGRYTLQGSLKLLTKVDASGVPTNPMVKKMLDWMQDNPLSDLSLALPFDLNQIYATRGVVPQCAMRVTKDSDQLGFRHYRHPRPCHCSFDMLATGKSSASCTPCVDASTCGAGQQCSHGYCE